MCQQTEVLFIKSPIKSKHIVSFSCFVSFTTAGSADSDNVPYACCCISKQFPSRPAYLNLKEMKQITFILLSQLCISLRVIHFLRSDVFPCSQRGEINRQPSSSQKAQDEIWLASGDWRGFWEERLDGFGRGMKETAHSMIHDMFVRVETIPACSYFTFKS